MIGHVKKGCLMDAAIIGINDKDRALFQGHAGFLLSDAPPTMLRNEVHVRQTVPKPVSDLDGLDPEEAGLDGLGWDGWDPEGLDLEGWGPGPFLDGLDPDGSIVDDLGLERSR